MDTCEIIAALEQCEQTCRELINEKRTQELEQPLRRWETLLPELSARREAATDYFYFSMVFQQINAILYKKAGQSSQMEKYYLAGKEAAQDLTALLPLHADPAGTPLRPRLMAENCAQFLVTAALAMEESDADVSLELASLAARLYDWLWPVLTEPVSVYAVEIHMKLASLVLLVLDNPAESKRQLAIVKQKYLELYERTGNSVYKKKAETDGLGVQDEKNVSEEVLASNPLLAMIYRAAQFGDMAARASEAGEEEQAAFYYEKAALEAERFLATGKMQTGETCRVAAVVFFGAAVYAAETSPNRAKELARQGIQMLDLLAGKFDGADISKGEIRRMRRELSKITDGSKTGFFRRILG